LYAVDPVALVMIRPSAFTLVTRPVLTETDSSMMRESAALPNTTSFSTMRESKRSRAR
jgi:hypothetical protein